MYDVYLYESNFTAHRERTLVILVHILLFVLLPQVQRLQLEYYSFPMLNMLQIQAHCLMQWSTTTNIIVEDSYCHHFDTAPPCKLFIWLSHKGLRGIVVGRAAVETKSH